MQEDSDKSWMDHTDDWYSEAYERPICVYVDGERVNEQDVEVLNIEEDMQGRDLLTFAYKGKEYKSYRVN
jgi:hypothetical protein